MIYECLTVIGIEVSLNESIIIKRGCRTNYNLYDI